MSGAARHTYRIDRRTAADHQTLLGSLLAVESMIVQPFQADIVRTGEDTLDGVRREGVSCGAEGAKPGDFQVQDDHGGTVHDLRPTTEQVELAERAIATCAPLPVYGRVDMVRGNDGRLAVMALELVEPELWLRCYPAASDLFADAVIAFPTGRE